MTLGLTITCGDCGKAEFFAGDLLTSAWAAVNSGHWYTDPKGFLVCGCKIGASDAASPSRSAGSQMELDLLL